MAKGTKRGLDLFRILGVQVALDYSWFVVFFLVAWSLAAGYFPQEYPGHAWASYAIVGLVATLLFFASVLAHELSHAAVANWLGDQVRRITLFIFGGMAELSGEPRSPRAELAIAAVGPLTSLALAGVFWIIFAGTARFGGDVMWRGVLRQLAFVNVALGLFNLLPGFPLDGGRLLRALLWRRSGDLRVATARAADWGIGIAGGLMLLGAAQIFLGGLVGGLWLIFVGMFLRGAARAGYQATIVEAALDRRRVADIMVTAPVRIDPDATLADAVENYFLRYGYAGFPVGGAAQVEGLVSLADVRGCAPAERAQRRVRDVMRPADAHVRILPSATLADALRRMGEADAGRLLVMEGEELRGLITRSGIARFVQMRTALEDEKN